MQWRLLDFAKAIKHRTKKEFEELRQSTNEAKTVTGTSHPFFHPQPKPSHSTSRKVPSVSIGRRSPALGRSNPLPKKSTKAKAKTSREQISPLQARFDAKRGALKKMEVEKRDLQGYVQALREFIRLFDSPTSGLGKKRTDYRRTRRDLLERIQCCIEHCWQGNSNEYFKQGDFPGVSPPAWPCQKCIKKKQCPRHVVLSDTSSDDSDWEL